MHIRGGLGRGLVAEGEYGRGGCEGIGGADLPQGIVGAAVRAARLSESNYPRRGVRVFLRLFQSFLLLQRGGHTGICPYILWGIGGGAPLFSRIGAWFRRGGRPPRTGAPTYFGEPPCTFAGRGVAMGTKKEVKIALHFFVALEGFEPSQAEPESDVLPLHHKALSF